MTTKVWQVMQQIEAHRHRAERLEAAASTASPLSAALLSDIAHQRREIAERLYALWRAGEMESAG